MQHLPGLQAKPKMGGLSYLVDGRLAVHVQGHGEPMLRCLPRDTDQHLSQPGVSRYVMTGRAAMKGWLRVTPPRP